MRAIGTIVLLLAAAGCARREEALPVYGEIPPFQLTAQDGAAFERTQLDGNIWVADFIFTTCSGPCPRMSAQMRRVQNAVTDLPGVRLVSFTVDPERDTPPVLAEYAKRYQADPRRWFFLTGEQARLHALAREAFKLHNVDGSMDHSTRFVLLDGRSRIRGYYSTAEEDNAVNRLIGDIRRLAREKS